MGSRYLRPSLYAIPSQGQVSFGVNESKADAGALAAVLGAAAGCDGAMCCTLPLHTLAGCEPSVLFIGKPAETRGICNMAPGRSMIV